jgi:hypothetical protein
MTKHRRIAMVLPLLAVLLPGGGRPPAAAVQHPRLLPEAAVFLELNHTDGDLGLHAAIDGGPWTELEIEGPRDRELLTIRSHGQLRAQGLTQLAFESAEPPFDELAPEDFFRRFPEGRYEIEARLSDGTTARASAALSHVLAAPPENILLSGVPASESCDAAVLPIVVPPVTIAWDPVNVSHPDVGARGPVKVSLYQLFVEGNGTSLGIDLPPTTTSFEVPAAVTSTGGTFKFEIIVRTSARNNTAVESCFVVLRD